MSSAPSTLSVVICAYTEERWSDLQAAVASVQRQDLPAREIIVVTDYNDALLERAQEAFAGVRVVANAEAKGLSGARNTGIAASTGAIVAFLDDDAMAEPGWIRHLLAPYADPLVLGVGGRVVPRWDDARPAWLPEEFDWVVGCTYTGHRSEPGPVRNLIGANMSVRRDVVTKIGGFRHSLGRTASLPAGCEETEFFIRASQQFPNGVVWYEPGGRGVAPGAQARATAKYFRARCFAEGISKTQISRLVGTEDGLASERAYTMRALPRAVRRELGLAVRTLDPKGIARAATVVTGVATTAGGYAAARVPGSLRWLPSRNACRQDASGARPLQWPRRDFEPALVTQIDIADGVQALAALDPGTGKTYTARRRAGAQPTRADRRARARARPVRALRRGARPRDPRPARRRGAVHRRSTPRADRHARARPAPDRRRHRHPGPAREPGPVPGVAAAARPSGGRDHRGGQRVRRPGDRGARPRARPRPTRGSSTSARTGPGSRAPTTAGSSTSRRPTSRSPTTTSWWTRPGWTSSPPASHTETHVGCVTGMIFPLELETPAQDWLEHYAGFNKGFEPRIFDPSRRSSDPLFPYTAGTFGSGANMAFRTDVLRAMRGFEPALGAGTEAKGGDDLAAFFDVIAAGHAIAYEPGAIVYHQHHRTFEALERQTFGYGAGLTAYLTKTIVEEPGRMLDMLAKAPRAAHHALSPSSSKNERLPGDTPADPGAQGTARDAGRPGALLPQPLGQPARRAPGAHRRDPAGGRPDVRRRELGSRRARRRASRPRRRTSISSRSSFAKRAWRHEPTHHPPRPPVPLVSPGARPEQHGWITAPEVFAEHMAYLHETATGRSPSRSTRRCSSSR